MIKTRRPIGEERKARETEMIRRKEKRREGEEKRILKIIDSLSLKEVILLKKNVVKIFDSEKLLFRL